MQRQPAQALLIDLDGVLRRWDPPAAVEEKYGLAPGSLLRTAMTWDIYRPAVAGEISDADWMRLIAQRLPLPEDQATAAVTEWQTHRGYVDEKVLACVREVRGAGRPVGLATNATDRLPDDLAALGLTDDFDVVASSRDLKIHKPAPEFFERACAALGLEPHWVLFIDDEDRAVRGARAAGLPAYRWSDHPDLPYLRAAFALP